MLTSCYMGSQHVTLISYNVSKIVLQNWSLIDLNMTVGPKYLQTYIGSQFEQALIKILILVYNCLNQEVLKYLMDMLTQKLKTYLFKKSFGF